MWELPLCSAAIPTYLPKQISVAFLILRAKGKRDNSLCLLASISAQILKARVWVAPVVCSLVSQVNILRHPVATLPPPPPAGAQDSRLQANSPLKMQFFKKKKKNAVLDAAPWGM